MTNTSQLGIPLRGSHSLTGNKTKAFISPVGLHTFLLNLLPGVGERHCDSPLQVKTVRQRELSYYSLRYLSHLIDGLYVRLRNSTWDLIWYPNLEETRGHFA